jgi:hypothetical protein
MLGGQGARPRPSLERAPLGGGTLGKASSSLWLGRPCHYHCQFALPRTRQLGVYLRGGEFGRLPRNHRGLVDVPGKNVRGAVVHPEAIFASSSATSFYQRAMWLSSRPKNLSSRRQTSSQ